ncbi:hypothetical protein DENSPDRAFT_836240 [Dentipellis sp. KUC8613]|nr:hypothetical protein DENSPDRAFT_836240 [Dentipellis sp. KUC8613]
MSNPEALEKIFEKLEAESERRAREEEQELYSPPSSLSRRTSAVQRKQRRSSISISRYGQVDNPSQKAAFSVPSTPSYSASTSFYKAQSHVHSTDSLSSVGSAETANCRRESDHTTQVQRIAGKQSISRSVGGMLSRKLSRSRSKASLTSGLDQPGVVIGVIVEEKTALATVTSEEHARPESRATAYGPPRGTLKNQASRYTIAGGSETVDAEMDTEDGGWVSRAKDLSKKIKRRSRALLTTERTTSQ